MTVKSIIKAAAIGYAAITLTANIAVNTLGYDRAFPIISHRAGIPIIEVLHSTVRNGELVDQFGAAFGCPVDGMPDGTKVHTLFVWDMTNNDCDTVWKRFDVLDLDENYDWKSYVCDPEWDAQVNWEAIE